MSVKIFESALRHAVIPPFELKIIHSCVVYWLYIYSSCRLYLHFICRRLYTAMRRRNTNIIKLMQQLYILFFTLSSAFSLVIFLGKVFKKINFMI